MIAIFNTMLYPWISDRSQIESTYDEDWRWVIAHKRDKSGDFVIDSKTGENQEYCYSVNVKNNNCYCENPARLVATKCFLITFGNFLYTGLSISINLLRIAYDIPCDILYGLGETFKKMQEENFLCGFYEGIIGLISQLSSDLYLDISQVIRSPIYALGIEIAAIEGFLLDPYKARSEIAIIERNWKRDLSFRDDIRLQSIVSFNSAKDYLNRAKTLFLAWCFQIQGNLDAKVGPEQEHKYEVLNTFDSYEEVHQMYDRNLIWQNKDCGIPCCPIVNTCG